MTLAEWASTVDVGHHRRRTPECTVAAADKRHTGRVADDILTHIHDLVAKEKDLRARLQAHQIDETEEHAQLRAIETELDQCWDLLRQRRALRDSGGDPREATLRPAEEVEGYSG